jgi:hypothetical protein
MVQYRVKSPPLIPILSQLNLIHSLTPYVISIRYTLMCLYPPIYVFVLQVVSFLQFFRLKIFKHFSSLAAVLHAPPKNLSRFDQPNNIWRGVGLQIMKILIMQLQSACWSLHSFLLRTNIQLSTLFPSTLSLYVVPRGCMPIEDNK